MIYLLYDAPGIENGPFGPGVMKQTAQLTGTIERELPFARKVTSLANAEFIEADGDDVRIHALVENMPDTQAELLRLRDVAP